MDAAYVVFHCLQLIVHRKEFPHVLTGNSERITVDDLIRKKYMRIGTLTFEGYCEAVRGFHGTIAPGMLIGGFMVELARNGLPDGVLFEALCETRFCLSINSNKLK
ncbi:MAG: hypothetical protein PHT49_08765 [Desulfovibrionales bacterium]|nr:hypothetical protein [Desulfovibrionales bacterium]